MKIGISNWRKTKERELHRETPRTADSEIVLVRQLTLRRRIHRFIGVREEGQQLVEMALILPIFVALILGIVYIGIDLNNYIILTDAVDAGARALSMARGQTNPALAGTDPCAYAVQIANNDAIGLKQSNITYSITYTAVGTTSSTAEGTSCAGLGGATGMSSQDQITMSASYPVTLPLVNQQGYLLWLHFGSLTLNAHSGQLVQ